MKLLLSLKSEYQKLRMCWKAVLGNIFGTEMYKLQLHWQEIPFHVIVLKQLLEHNTIPLIIKHITHNPQAIIWIKIP
jgi:hypothetical protein